MRPSQSAHLDYLRVMKAEGILPEDAQPHLDELETAEALERRRQIEDADLARAMATMVHSDAGRYVFQYLREVYVDRELFHENHAVMAERVAAHDLVVRMLKMAETQEQTFDE